MWLRIEKMAVLCGLLSSGMWNVKVWLKLTWSFYFTVHGLWWNMDIRIWCGNENAVFTMGWKKFSETEKGAMSLVERESHFDNFFWHRGCCVSWILSQGQTVNCWYYLEVLKRLREISGEKYLSCGETTPGSSILIIHQFMHRYWFVTFWLTWTQLCFLSHPTHLTSLRQTLSYFPNWNPLRKDGNFRRFKRLRKIRRRS
jgi:hypothetical protein